MNPPPEPTPPTPPASAPPPAEAPAEPRPQYEFDKAQNEVIDSLARSMIWVGVPLTILAIVYGITAVVHVIRVYRDSLEIVAALAAAGVVPGDRVAVMAGNSVPHIEAMIAIVRTGAVCVPVNFRMVAGEVAYVLADSGAAAVLVDDAFAPVVAAARTPGVRAVLTVGAGYDAQVDM